VEAIILPAFIHPLFRRATFISARRSRVPRGKMRAPEEVTPCGKGCLGNINVRDFVRLHYLLRTAGGRPRDFQKA
jgi:hypothetical protein